jgi:hypothetical protein
MLIKENKKAIKGSITTSMEYMDGQLVSARAKVAGRTKVLQDVYQVLFFLRI